MHICTLSLCLSLSLTTVEKFSYWCFPPFSPSGIKQAAKQNILLPTGTQRNLCPNKPAVRLICMPAIPCNIITLISDYSAGSPRAFFFSHIHQLANKNKPFIGKQAV